MAAPGGSAHIGFAGTDCHSCSWTILCFRLQGVLFHLNCNKPTRGPPAVLFFVWLSFVAHCSLSPAETHNLPKQPPLAQAVGQAAQCLTIMARTGSGSCAFASVDDYLH